MEWVSNSIAQQWGQLVVNDIELTQGETHVEVYTLPISFTSHSSYFAVATPYDRNGYAMGYVYRCQNSGHTGITIGYYCDVLLGSVSSLRTFTINIIALGDYD